jgi:hypothetical protein
MYITIAAIVCRFEFQLFETYRERDIDYVRDCFLGETDPASPGVRIKVIADTSKFALETPV